jgi:hypothetical protein
MDGQTADDLGVSLLKGEVSVAASARKYGLTVAEVEDGSPPSVAIASGDVRHSFSPMRNKSVWIKYSFLWVTGLIFVFCLIGHWIFALLLL